MKFNSVSLILDGLNLEGFNKRLTFPNNSLIQKLELVYLNEWNNI